MMKLPIKLIAKSYADTFAGKSKDEAYLDGAIAALEWAVSLTFSGQTPGMIRFWIEQKIDEARADS